MVTKKIARTKAGAALTRTALAKMMKTKSDALHAVIAAHLADMPGVKLHSMHFSVAPKGVSDPCGGRCRPGQVCLLSSSGEFVCV